MPLTLADVRQWWERKRSDIPDDDAIGFLFTAIEDLAWLLNEAVDESDFWTNDAGWERIDKIRTYLGKRSVLGA